MRFRCSFLLLCLLTCLHATNLSAHVEQAILRVQVESSGQPVEGAAVSIDGVTYATDRLGRTTATVRPGRVDVVVRKTGFAEASSTVDVEAGSTRELVVNLDLEATHEEVTVVATTRTDRRLEDQPMRVEVLNREEIEEKMLMTPGDIVMMLNEMGGMRVQAMSPSLGAASVRIQGMRGRYTTVLSDGLPLFGDVGGLGLLQIPPMDLGQVEVVKGVASALYGAGAMGGVVNLLSRRPGLAPQYEVLANQSTRGATDAVAFLSGPFANNWSATLLTGGHWQRAQDVNGDEWADLPGYARGVVRPRVFWENGRGASLFATAGFTYEDRQGGTIDGAVLAGLGLPYIEALETIRYDAGLLTQSLVNERFVVTTRAAVARQHHDHQFGDTLERDRHDTLFAEVAVRGTTGRQTWVGGLALERDAYTPLDVPRFEYAYTVPGAFVQYDVDVNPAFTLSSSGRIDVHSEYGLFFSPRISALFRAGRWTSRGSIGTGFFPSSPLTEETEAAGLSRLQTSGSLAAERGLSMSFDLTRTDGPLSYTATLFSSRIEDPTHVDRSPVYAIRTLPEPTTNVGVELLATLRHAPFSVTGTYTYVQARESVDEIEDDVPQTPRHSAGIVAMWEAEDVGRVGFEWYFTGRQRLEENPFRDVSVPYVVVGLLAEKSFGALRVFVNGENLTGVRQTRWDPLLRPSPGADGRWTVDAWAPLEGRNINGGVRLTF